MNDLISRQAVRLIESDSNAYPEVWNESYEKGFCDAINRVLDLPSAQPDVARSIATIIENEKDMKVILKSKTSAQPEPLTDKEQRIFLAAMGREEKVCKQLDDECRDCREPYEDSLVKTCHEIKRKVKGALWT